MVTPRAPVPFPVPPRKPPWSGWAQQGRYWHLALIHASKTTWRQWDQNAVALIVAFAVPWIVIGTLVLLRPAAVPDLVLTVAVAALIELAVAGCLFALNLLLAPARMWHATMEQIGNFATANAGSYRDRADFLIYTMRLRLCYGQPWDDLQKDEDAWEESVAMLLADRPDDLALFQRPMAIEDSITDPAQYLLAWMTIKRERLARLVDRLRAEETPLPYPYEEPDA